ncbi:hypothetical protein Tter_2785 [Thermobaculum terrenum ATCC BAA-798]|uniref:Uncharacterized protein n=1 Tax=Thermobaculum terrenum (strain ATCC BAA-798 / CCMEE 7001 / YNP1) TaxID=525904 RepID=D1CIU9_THET1|nr:hypothetical protein Tter_2785 [Thermobaculum terrenum ATCC BAA-798]
MCQLTCVLTHIELKHVWLAPYIWWRFRRIHRLLTDTPGLIRSTILFQSPRCIFFMSFREFAWINFRLPEAPRSVPKIMVG